MPRPSRSVATGMAASAAAVIAAPLVLIVPAQAVTGSDAAANSYAFTTRLDIGAGQRACSGALVYSDWVLSAASCFDDNPADGLSVPSGAPKQATTATVGRTDTTTTTGQVRDVTQLVPYPGQDLVLAKLALPVTDITPVSLATTAPVAGEELRVTGYGRTKDEWTPVKMHTGAFTVASATGDEVNITGKDGAAVCKGDAGGPLLREAAGSVRLVGVNSRSWQGGCFGTAVGADETPTGAIATRLDQLRAWVGANVEPVCNPQGALYSVVSDGSLLRRNLDDPMNGTGTVPGASTIDTGWQSYGRVLAGTSATFYGIKSDGIYLSHRVAATATWDVHHKKISSAFTAYAQAANHSRITVDRTGHIWYVDTDGDLRWAQYDTVAGTWNSQGDKKVDTGWNAYTHVFAADDGVLYGIDSATGHLIRSRYDFTSQRWIQHQATVNTADWRDTKEITSFGGDTILRVKTTGEMRQYRYNEGTGVFDSWNKLVGSGTNWTLYTSISTAPDNCYLRGDRSPALPSVERTPDAAGSVLQASTGEIQYAYVDADGRLVHGRQAKGADLSAVQWTTGAAGETYTGRPQLAEQPDTKVALVAQQTDSDVVWRRHVQGAADTPSWTDLHGSMKGHPVTAERADGVLVEFSVDAAGVPWYRAQQRPNVDFLGWSRLTGSGLSGQLSAVTTGTSVQLFATDTAGQLRTATFTNGALGTWSDVGNRAVSDAPSVVVRGDGRLGVFARVADGKVVTAEQSAAGGEFAAAWTPVGDLTAAGAPSAVVNPATGFTQVVARSADGTIHQTEEAVKGAYGTWNTWTQVSAEVSATDPAAFAYTTATGAAWAYLYRNGSNQPRIQQGQ
ncbi:tachylectin-related carbohydrate-binding protein [Streptomyces sp. NPDC005892]|uniref:tachylectin-related carbohydrate-binding protein n=1 Tax=Streptomyces sp. NPDC005892 TaxID=3155593 RepID=UPI0033F1E947